MQYITTVWKIMFNNKLYGSFFWLGVWFSLTVPMIIFGNYILSILGLVFIGIEVKRINNEVN